MDDALHTMLAGWGNYYLITGTAAAALTGLQFVVHTLLLSGGLRSVGDDDPEGAIAAFGTPNVVHFSLALIISAILCAPWRDYSSLRATLGLLGAGALVYSAAVLRRALRQRSYVPAFEDWLWHLLLPAVAYAAILPAALLLGSETAWPLFAVAAATMILLCVGIHNAWDTVTYLTINALRTGAPGNRPAPPRRNDPGSRGRRRR